MTRTRDVNPAHANLQEGLTGWLTGAGPQLQRVAAQRFQLSQIVLKRHPPLLRTSQHIAVELGSANHPPTAALQQMTINLEAVRATVEHVHILDARSRRADVVDHLVPNLRFALACQALGGVLAAVRGPVLAAGIKTPPPPPPPLPPPGPPPPRRG